MSCFNLYCLSTYVPDWHIVYVGNRRVQCLLILIHLGYGVLGAWLAIGLDEWVRGLIMAKRWRSQVWTKFSLVNEKKEVQDTI
ncbi:hypothetical protein L4D76_27730 [Photobacterium sagamiensis]